uniref:WAS protein family 2 n=3 Tax=Lygus hesperus TaxID=30085 RepID=A0A146LJG7_LYGHE
MKRQIDIPLVQQDLSHEETILQISLSLEKLQKVVSNLFTNIDGKIASQSQQLADVQARCDSARRKVEKLTGIDKSVQVFSSSKFPGPTPPTFYPLENLEIEETRSDIRIPFTPLPQDKLSINEKLKFYHIKDNTIQLRKNESITPSEGLGEVPDGIKTVNSLLLYNTKQNLYSHYKILDPLTPAHKHIVVEDKDSRPIIGPAPLSLASAVDSLPSVQNFFYSPGLEDVPDIKAPLNLNLTGIAGDLRFGEVEDQIDFPARSKSEELGFRKDDIIDISPHEEVLETRGTNVDVTKTVVAKPAESPKKVEPVGAPPPPPPPPPMPPPDVAVVEPTPVPKPRTEVQQIKSSAAVIPPVATDSRADLMAAIRKAGGSGKAKLKPVAHDSETSETNTTSKKPGNFMEDLHAKLSMRRKGISGRVDVSEGGQVGMLERINSMIPPPPPKDSDTATEDGSDWEE